MPTLPEWQPSNTSMSSNDLAIRIHVVPNEVTKTMVFPSQLLISDVYKRIRSGIREAGACKEEDYGLFIPQENSRGQWLDFAQTLAYYSIKSGDIIEFRCSYRPLIVRTLDGIRKTLRVSDSKPVGELMPEIAEKMGITNYEEYGLLRELDTVDRERTSTLRRNASANSRNSEKMERMKKKLHTDDELHWLILSRTMRDQGIDEKEVVLLRRRYFFSDKNIDPRDPVQLSLLYVQLRDAIVQGAHPVTQEEAIRLAATQCQVQLGNYTQEKCRLGTIKLREYLPKEYCKVRGIEKKIYQEHATLKDVSELDAKFRYCQFCRSLKTYGITFFLVREKLFGKNKLCPRLLGINKDSVVRVHEKTKEVLQTWPLTSIKQWAVRANIFTLNFGNYAPNEMYTVQTTEGEQISQLLSGYVDMIRKRQVKDHPAMEGDEMSAMTVEQVMPSKATVVHHYKTDVSQDASFSPTQVMEGHIAVPGVHRGAPRVLRNGPGEDVPDMMSPMSGRDSPVDISMAGTQTFHVQTLPTAQRAFISSVRENLEVLRDARDALDMGLQGMPEVGDDEVSRQYRLEVGDVSKQRVTDELGAMSAATARAIRHSHAFDARPATTKQDRGEDLMMMQQSFRVITVQFPSLVEDVKRVAWSEEVHVQERDNQSGGGDDLLDAARKLADAFSGLLSAAAQPTLQSPMSAGVGETIDPWPDTNITNEEETSTSANSTISGKRALLRAANRVGEASSELLRHVTEPPSLNDVPPGYDSQVLVAGDISDGFRDEVLELAGQVTYYITVLVRAAKESARQLQFEGWPYQDLINTAGQLGLIAGQFITCAKLVTATLQQSACQQQLRVALDDVGVGVNSVVMAAQNIDMRGMEDAGTSLGVEDELRPSAEDVLLAIERLSLLMQRLTGSGASENDLDGILLSMWEAYESVRSESDGSRLVGASRKLAQATALLVTSIKAQSQSLTTDSSTDSTEKQRKLLHSARQLADATSRLLSAAKDLANDQHNAELQVTLRHSADYLLLTAYLYVDGVSPRVVYSLQLAARSAVTAATQLLNTSQNAAKKSRASNYQVCEDARHVADLISKMVLSVREAKRDPLDSLVILELIATCQEFIQPCQSLCNSSYSLQPTVIDSSLQAALGYAIQQLRDAVYHLQVALGRSEPLSRLVQLPGSVLWLKRLLDTVDLWQRSLHRNSLVLMNLPSVRGSIAGTDNVERMEEGCLRLTQAVKQSAFSANQLLSNLIRLEGWEKANKDGNYSEGGRPLEIDAAEESLCGWSRDLALALDALLQTTRGVSSAAANRLFEKDVPILSRNQNDTELEMMSRDLQIGMLKDCQQALIHAHNLLRQVCHLRGIPIGSETLLLDGQQNVNQLVEELTAALEHCLNGLPYHKDIDSALNLLREVKNKFEMQILQYEHYQTDSGMTASQLEAAINEFTTAAVSLNQMSLELANCNSLSGFAVGSQRLVESVHDLLMKWGLPLSEMYFIISPATSNNDSRGRVIQNHMLELLHLLERLLIEAKNLCTQQEIITGQNMIMNADGHQLASGNRPALHKAVNDLSAVISKLLSLCTNSLTAAEQACDAAIHRLQNIRPLLDHPLHALRMEDYYTAIDQITHSTPLLADGLKGMPFSANERDTDLFCLSVTKCVDSVTCIVEETAHIAYLVGIADPRSEPGRSGVVDLQSLQQSERDIHQSCDAIVNHVAPISTYATASDILTENSVVMIVQHASTIAQSAKRLCDACRSVSHMVANPVAKRQLIQLAKQVVVTTSQLMSRASHIDQQMKGGISSIPAQEMSRSLIIECQDIILSVQEMMRCVMAGDFVGRPARITQEARQAQEPICHAGYSVVDSMSRVFHVAKSVIANSGSPAATKSTFAQYSDTSKELSEDMKQLIAIIKENAPGQKECSQALKCEQVASERLEKARFTLMTVANQPSSVVQQALREFLPLSQENSEEGYQKTLSHTVRQLRQSVALCSQASKSDASRLGHAVLTLSDYFEPLVQCTVGAASKTSLAQNQTVYEQHTKTVLESCRLYVTAVKEAGGNPRAIHSHEQVNEMEVGVNEACEDLLTALDNMSTSQGNVNTVIDTLETSVMDQQQLQQTSQFRSSQLCTTMSDNNGQMNRIKDIVRHMITLCQQINTRIAMHEAQHDMAPLSNQLKQEYQELLEQCKALSSMYLSSNDDANIQRSHQILQGVQAVGKACLSLIRRVAEVAAASADGTSLIKHELAQQNCHRAAQDLVERLEELLAEAIGSGMSLNAPVGDTMTTSQTSALSMVPKVNEHLAIMPASQRNAASTVSGIISDLDTTIMFASAGTYHAANSPSTSHGQQLTHLGSKTSEEWPPDAKHFRETVVKVAKALVDDTRALVKGSDGPEEQLALSSQQAVATMAKLADSVRRGSMTLQSNEAQVLLLNAARDVAMNLHELLDSVWRVHLHQRPEDYGRMKENARNTIGNVTNLLRTLKLIEDENTRSVQALDMAIEAVNQELQQLLPYLHGESSDKQALAVPMNQSKYHRHALPDTLAHLYQPVLSVAGYIVSAGTTLADNEVINASLNCKQTAADIASVTKAVVYHVDKEEWREKTSCLAKTLLECYLELLRGLRQLLHNVEDAQAKTKMVHAAKKVKDSAPMLNVISEGLREGHRLIMYFHPSSPEWRDVTEKFIGRHVAYHHHHHHHHQHHQHHHQETRHSAHESPLSSTCKPPGGTETSNNATTITIEHSGNTNNEPIEVRLLQTGQTMNHVHEKQTTISSQPSSSPYKSASNDSDEFIQTSIRAVVQCSKELIDAAITTRNALQLEDQSQGMNSTPRRSSLTSERVLSAAKEVGAATHILCDSLSSGQTKQQNSSDPRLLEAARRISANARLILNSYDPREWNAASHSSDMQLEESIGKERKRSFALLQEACKSVEDTTSHLIDVLQDSETSKQEDTGPTSTMLQNSKQIILTEAEIMAREQELTILRNQSRDIRRQQQRDHPHLYSENQQDI